MMTDEYKGDNVKVRGEEFDDHPNQEVEAEETKFDPPIKGGREAQRRNQNFN